MKATPALSKFFSLILLTLVAGTGQLAMGRQDDAPTVQWSVIPEAWLVRQVATKDGVSVHLADRIGWSEACIGELQEVAKESDQIWFFDNGGLAERRGRIGFALLRGGKVIAHIVTVVS